MEANATGRDAATLAVRAVPVLCVIWLLARFLPAPSSTPPAVLASLSGVRAFASPETGRFELLGLAGVDDLESPALGSLRHRLVSEVETANEELARLGMRTAGRLEIFPEDGVMGVRLSGTLVPFYDQDATRLEIARRTAPERPWSALETIVEVLDGRLSEPREGFQLEAATEQRELTRLYREIDDALRQQEADVTEAVAAFRRDAARAAVASGGPFRRTGAGRILEVLLAALLGTALAAALRRHPPELPPRVVLSFAPVLATAVVLLMEGTALLPVDPVRGTSLVFLPLAFGLGLAGEGVLVIASRLPRLVAARARDAATAPPPEAPVSHPRPPAPAGSLPLRPPAPPRQERPRPTAGRDETSRPMRPPEDRLPFFPKRRRPTE